MLAKNGLFHSAVPYSNLPPRWGEEDVITRLPAEGKLWKGPRSRKAAHNGPSSQRRTSSWGDFCGGTRPSLCPSDMEPKRIREGYLVKRVSKVPPARVSLEIGWGRIGVQLCTLYLLNLLGWNGRASQPVEGRSGAEKPVRVPLPSGS